LIAFFLFRHLFYDPLVVLCNPAIKKSREKIKVKVYHRLLSRLVTQR
jgi:hypothetical protein